MRLYTTGQVSKLCNVATSTVNKWFDSGKLKGFRVPGSRHRRIPRENLIDFLNEHGVPIKSLNDTQNLKVLVVSRDRRLTDRICNEMSLDRMLDVAVASSSFALGFQIETFQPDCIIVDFAIGEGEATQICDNIRNRDEHCSLILIGIMPLNAPLSVQSGTHVSDTFSRPFDPGLLIQRIRTLVGVA